MKNLAEQLEFDDLEAEVKQTPLVLIENEETFEEVNIFRGLWRIFYSAAKRFVDILAGICGLIILIPIMLIVKIAYLKDGDKAPILFKQTRIGKGGKEIKIYKIRSMVVGADKILEDMLASDPEIRAEYQANKKLKDDPRITKVGKIIRKTSIDEFPQFLNILKGDMTLVGPRPYLPREREDMERYYNDIIQCKPGLTGLWQISGRSDVNFMNRCRLDSFYNKHKCLVFDGKIFLRTFGVVFKKSGAV